MKPKTPEQKAKQEAQRSCIGRSPERIKKSIRRAVEFGIWCPLVKK